MFAASKVAGAVSAAVNYIEDVFSTYLYAGNSSTNPIANGIDLSTKGGLVWLKGRTSAGYSNVLSDTARGISNALISDSTNAQYSNPTGITSLSTTGFTLGSASGTNGTIGGNYVSWTFRKQPKFFDVVTYSGNSGVQNIAHNLGSVPGCIIIKCITNPPAVGSTDWTVYHRSLANTQFVALNTTSAASTNTNYWNSTTPTSTYFTLGNETDTNRTGGTYVAYLFAHNAGGFGLTGTDNVISCGSYTGNGSSTGPIVTLGYEPQWLLIKNTTTGDTGTGWRLLDNMRGITTGGTDGILFANSSNAEVYSNVCDVNATGFQITTTGTGVNSSGDTFIYIAIRRGPMKVPTDGTTVFSPNLATNTEGVGTVKTTNFPIDLQFTKTTTSGGSFYAVDRLRGISTNTTDSANILVTNTTAAESSSAITRYWSNTNFQISSAIGNSDQIYLNLRRAPSFFDEVCYTGNGAGAAHAHNLGVVPELMIIKDRGASAVQPWTVYASAVGNTSALFLNTTAAASAASAGYWNNTTPSATTFTTGWGNSVETNANNYVAYLFASCPGVSKVGSYTGTGATQTISCGFTGGARFVMIKRTDSTSNWYIWDTTRGMVAGTDPALWFNATTAAQANNNSVYTTTTGFQLLASPFADVNTNGGSYIYLAIA